MAQVASWSTSETVGLWSDGLSSTAASIVDAPTQCYSPMQMAEPWLDCAFVHFQSLFRNCQECLVDFLIDSSWPMASYGPLLMGSRSPF